MNGFACIALDNPKHAENVGGAIRAAYAYGAAQVSISGARGHSAYRKMVRHGTNTPKGERHLPIFTVSDATYLHPVGAQLIAVDLIDGATPLPLFQHPKQAVYIFGAEDATLGKRITDKCAHRVYVPTRCCMNLAATINVVMYDRIAKGVETGSIYAGWQGARAFYDRSAA